MVLYELMKKFYRESAGEWKYYKGNMINPFEDRFDISDFIRKYFDYGGKGMVVAELINEMEPMRHYHTISTFFIGLLIKKKICPTLEIINDADENDNFEFSYLWFLVCLFHDMGYVQEKDWTYKYKYRENSNDYIRNYGKGKWRNHRDKGYEFDDLGIVYAVPSIVKRMTSKCKDMDFKKSGSYLVRFNNEIEISDAMYSRKTILNYLEFCKMDENIRHYDHGIVGGLWLYDSLMKNYNKQFVIKKRTDKNIDFYNFSIPENLHFFAEQRNIFAYLADCINAYNMWPANEGTNQKYKKCKLDELTKERFKLIRFRDNPILFILALADTLEPIKTYADLHMSEIEIWSGIDIEIEQDSLIIKVLDNRMPFDRIASKVIGIDEWIDVKIVIDTECRELKIKY